MGGGLSSAEYQRAAKYPRAANLPHGVFLCPGINPHTLSGDALNRLDALTAASVTDGPVTVVGLKIYAGYYHFDISDPVYEPVYRFAEKHNLTVVIHSGDTFSERGLLEYSHPLRADRLAVNHPDMRVVLCHLGAPWVFDACEVACKNRNVYVDLSGLLVGDGRYIADMAGKPPLQDRYRQALVFMDRYDKVLFGSDWPLAPMGAYIDFCRGLVPPEEHWRVFYQNARDVFFDRRVR